MNRLSMCSQISLNTKCGTTCITDKLTTSANRIFEANHELKISPFIVTDMVYC